MSKEEPPEKEARTPTTEELLAEVVRATKENRKTIETMAKAIVQLNKKIESKGGSSKSGGGGALGILEAIIKRESGGLDQFAKQAEAFARAADAIEHFRRPSKIGVGEALLMRVGMRAAFPRYMTKKELERFERVGGVWEALEEAEETGHVSE
ncbi:MAG: hypothetical protein HWN68_17290 [Desulfobacterales bacterium]|nr:hypothetical protein [Desulfobacterales bacterium]